MRKLKRQMRRPEVDQVIEQEVDEAMEPEVEFVMENEIGKVTPKKKRLMRRPEVEKKTGLPRSSIYEQMAKGEFPKPVDLCGGRAKAWIEDEIDSWIDAAIARRDSGMVSTPELSAR